MAWNWYGAKTLYRYRARGRARRPDRGFNRENTLVEERVVLFRARSFDEAISRAEAEAISYSEGEVTRLPESKQ